MRSVSSPDRKARRSRKVQWKRVPAIGSLKYRVRFTVGLKNGGTRPSHHVSQSVAHRRRSGNRRLSRRRAAAGGSAVGAIGTLTEPQHGGMKSFALLSSKKKRVR